MRVLLWFVNVEILLCMVLGSEGVSSPALHDQPDVSITANAVSATLTQAEPSIAVDPQNSNTLLVTTNTWTDATYSSIVGTTASFSFDGGLTWTVQESPTGSFTFGDPAAGIGIDGRFFNGYLITGANGMGVAYSPDQGQTWTAVVADSMSGDRGHLWVDTIAGSIDQGNIYFAWTVEPVGELRFKRSVNNGLSYEDQSTISGVLKPRTQAFGVNLSANPLQYDDRIECNRAG